MNSVQIEAMDKEIAALFAEAFALTARALCKLAEFDRAECAAALGYQSTAHWMNFRLGISLGTAREHVRVARALELLPDTSEKFSAGTLSFSKVRALTRIANANNEKQLVQLAGQSTASQLEKLVRGVRRVSGETAASQHASRGVHMGFDEEGMFFVRARLMPDEGARLMQALDGLMSADPGRSLEERRADALMSLGSQKTETELVLHTYEDEQGQIETSRGERVGVSAETEWRLSCDAALVRVSHAEDGNVLDVGRKSRKISLSMRRALTERDRCCRFPGCSNTIVDCHHIKHWRDGGPTDLANMTLLCRFHHGLVHERGYRVKLSADGAAAFFDPQGAPVASPQPLSRVEPRAAGAHAWPGVDFTWRTFDTSLAVTGLV